MLKQKSGVTNHIPFDSISSFVLSVLFVAEVKSDNSCL